MENKITGHTQLTGLLGYPVKHSLSPKIHNTAFNILGLDYVYLAFNVEKGNLKKAVDGLKAINAKGFNVTMPYKQEIMKYLDTVSEEARLIGSVNTVLNDNGRLTGFNVDGKGYVHSLLEEGVEIEEKKIVMIGAGGAARSVAIQLALDGAKEIYIFNRTLERAQEIADVINNNITKAKASALLLDNDKLKKILNGADILINCTPIGMAPMEGKSVVEDRSLFKPDLIASDLIYQPSKTRFLKIAEEEGCKIVNGLGMLLWQGALCFKIWTGYEMPMEQIKLQV